MRPNAVQAVTAPIIGALVLRAQKFLSELVKLEDGQYFDHLTLHWEVGTYEEVDPDHNYNAQTYLDAGNWMFKVTHDPRANAVEIPKDAPTGSYAAHTLGRNSHNFGAGISAMWGATPNDFGQYPIKMPETEAFLAMCGAICIAYNLDPTNSDVAKTHAEWAIADNYYLGEDDDPRWDFARDAAAPGDPDVEEATAVAQRMRARIKLYKDAIAALHV